MPRSLNESERASMVEAIRNGGGCNEIARQFRRSPSTISKIAETEGLQFEHSRPKKANEARSSYARAERRELLNQGFDRASDLLDDIQDAGEFQKWTTALGIMIDKARLEEGEATERTENVASTRREKIRKSLDELAAFRSRRGLDEAVD